MLNKLKKYLNKRSDETLLTLRDVVIEKPTETKENTVKKEIWLDGDVPLPKKQLFVLEAGVPIPAPKPKVKPPRPPRASKYPFVGMKVGQSFFIPHAEKHRVDSAAWQHRKKRPPFQYEIHPFGKGFRLWRTK